MGLPLFVGLAIYALFRTHGVDELAWVRELVCEPGCLGRDLAVSSFILFSLPDGLWLYALMSAIATVWSDFEGLPRNLWWTACWVVGPLHEGLQAWGFVKGTFDPLDLLAYLVAAGLAHRIHRGNPLPRGHLTPRNDWSRLQSE